MLKRSTPALCRVEGAIMYGLFMSYLHIDVDKQGSQRYEIPHGLAQEVLGGKGLATRLLLNSNPPGVDPLSPENHLILACGPLSGTRIWGSARYGVFTKSPQTGMYSESYSGGTVAEYMVKTGQDAFVLSGQAEQLTWIEISDEGVHFHQARGLAGMDTFATEDWIKNWVKKNRPAADGCGVVVIGPAGENLVSCAVIENDYWRSAGRTGVGAVMGSKNIKAIVFHGQAHKEVAEPEAVKQAVKRMSSTAQDNPGVKAYKSFGTPMMVDMLNEAKAFPSRYWSKGVSGFRDDINAAAHQERCDVKATACPKCFMACGKLSTVKSGRHQGLQLEGPEYETIYAFGGLCDIGSIEEIMYLNDLCDRLGLDTITAGNLAALTIEAARQGRIESGPEYGDVDGIARLIEDMAHQRGRGAVLAKGIKEVAKIWNLEDLAVHVKGLEPAGYDPRVLKGMGLSYGSSDRGACHLRATFYKPELSGMIDRDQTKGKAAMFAEWEDRLTLFDTLILCRFYRDLYQWDELSTVISAVTGLDLDIAHMRRIASRISDDTRQFNIREGWVPEDDHLPVSLTEKPLPETGATITRQHMETMLEEYYLERGWDSSGYPR